MNSAGGCNWEYKHKMWPKHVNEDNWSQHAPPLTHDMLTLFSLYSTLHGLLWAPFPACSLCPYPVPFSHHALFLLACRIVELFPAVPINPHWGIVSKCLAYSKAACDPFVYSLLRHQYKKTCTDIINKMLKRSSLNASERAPQHQGNNLPTAEGWRADNYPGNMNPIYFWWRKGQMLFFFCPCQLKISLICWKGFFF